KHARIGATGTDGIGQWAGAKHHAFSRGKIRRGDGERDPQLFKSFYLQQFVQEGQHAQIRREAEARNGPAGEVAKTHPGSDLFEFGWAHAAAVGSSYQRANAGPCHAADGDVFFFEDFENANVNDAPGKAST